MRQPCRKAVAPEWMDEKRGDTGSCDASAQPGEGRGTQVRGDEIHWEARGTAKAAKPSRVLCACWRGGRTDREVSDCRTAMSACGGVILSRAGDVAYLKGLIPPGPG